MSKIQIITLTTFLLLAHSLNAKSREIVVIESTRFESGDSNSPSKQLQFTQRGQGWIVKFTNKTNYYILTPAHVVEGAHEIGFYCAKDTKLSVSLIKSSPTLDIALLEMPHNIPKDCFLNPLITIDFISAKGTVSPFNPTSSGFRYATLENETFVSGIIINEPVKTKNIITFPLESELYIDNIGIQPGMSGAAAVLANESDSIVGMATKTKTNGNITLGIPTNDLVRFAMDLLNGKDPWKKTNPLTEITFSYVQNENILSRYQNLLIHKNNQVLQFQELCPASEYHPSSNWILAGGPFVDSSDSFILTGGPFTDGSSSHANRALLQSEYTGNSNLFIQTQRHGLKVLASYYKQMNLCKDEGIKLSDGRILLGLFNASTHKFTKLDDLRKLFKIIMQNPENFEDNINQYGVFKSDISKMNYDLFCKNVLGEDFYAEPVSSSMPVGHFASKNTEVIKEILGISHASSLWSAKKISSILPSSWIKPPLSSRSHHQSFAHCESRTDMGPNHEKNNWIHFRYLSERDNEISFDLYFFPGVLGGQILLPLHQSKSNGEKTEFFQDTFKLKDNKYWSHFVTTNKGIKLQISLNPENPFIEINILHIPPDIVKTISLPITKDSNIPLWLYKFTGEMQLDSTKKNMMFVPE